MELLQSGLIPGLDGPSEDRGLGQSLPDRGRSEYFVRISKDIWLQSNEDFPQEAANHLTKGGVVHSGGGQAGLAIKLKCF